MRGTGYIFIVLLLACFTLFSQQRETRAKVQIKGTVKTMETRSPMAGVTVSTDNGAFTKTNALGEFKITANIGDQLTFQSPEFETVRHLIKNDEDVDVLVQGYPSTQGKGTRSAVATNEVSLHKTYLDSAAFYKRSNIEKSIDFITQSISQLGNRADKKQLAESLTALGEVYQYHKQYDLAITNYLDALEAHKTTRTALLLGEVYLLNRAYQNAEETLLPLLEIKNMVPYQRVELFEFLGDVYAGSNQVDKAIAYYEQGLKIAKKNQITPKMADLNSKIGDVYAKGDRLQEAEAYYGNSLELANSQTPQRALQEKEKVADFYNQKNAFGEEIKLRKKSLDELKNLPKSAPENVNASLDTDTITSQRINYKIANAFIAQDKYDQAIPYLQRSIKEADTEDDLLVQKDATRKLSEVYKYKGDYSKALETYQQYVAVVDTLYVRKEQEISRAARFNREIAAKQSRISGLEQERELSQSKYDLALAEQKLVQENNRRQKWLIYSLLFGMILLGVAAFFFYRSNQQQKLANNLLALKSLRSQMNPHFIFNALNSVNNYIAKNDERSANRYLSEFSTLMRAVLENSEEDFIPLSKELELLELYTKLEHSRFAEKFDYKIKIDENIAIEAFQIPPMLLQPYIENAIWHGLRYKEHKGFLEVNVNKLSDDSIEIIIMDNGIGRKKSAEYKTEHQKKQKSKAMGNIKKRIAILNQMYKNQVEVSISDLAADGSGTQVRFTLKKHT
ncbi:MAG: histidine kinase [Maribacter sp.]|nr:histidine kinase [Maribacter sp.]